MTFSRTARPRKHIFCISVKNHSVVSRPEGHDRDLARQYARKLGLCESAIEVAVGTLSGGNQQKVVLARWLARRPKLLIRDEPTRGVDVGAKAEIYQLIRNIAGEGVRLFSPS
jgi:ABC-type sugar transport system ATPase subunit